LRTPIANNGVGVTFCGLAVTTHGALDRAHPARPASLDPDREDRLQRTWRSLFTAPELVNFEPFCPKSSLSDAY
jgi:hypothetical protein